jgi:hypothetical protein
MLKKNWSILQKINKIRCIIISYRLAAYPTTNISTTYSCHTLKYSFFAAIIITCMACDVGSEHLSKSKHYPSSTIIRKVNDRLII